MLIILETEQKISMVTQFVYRNNIQYFKIYKEQANKND